MQKRTGSRQLAAACCTTLLPQAMRAAGGCGALMPAVVNMHYMLAWPGGISMTVPVMTWQGLPPLPAAGSLLPCWTGQPPAADTLLP